MPVAEELADWYARGEWFAGWIKLRRTEPGEAELTFTAANARHEGAMTNEQKREYISALLRERDGAERYGRDGTVAEIDAELARVGHRARTPHQRAETMVAPARGPVDQAPEPKPAPKPTPEPAPEPAAAAVTPKRGPGRPRKNG